MVVEGQKTAAGEKIGGGGEINIPGCALARGIIARDSPAILASLQPVSLTSLSFENKCLVGCDGYFCRLAVTVGCNGWVVTVTCAGWL